MIGSGDRTMTVGRDVSNDKFAFSLLFSLNACMRQLNTYMCANCFQSKFESMSNL